jgi:hypothetical protein
MDNVDAPVVPGGDGGADGVRNIEARTVVETVSSTVSSSEGEGRLGEARAPVCFGRASKCPLLCGIGPNNGIRRSARERVEGKDQREGTGSPSHAGIGDARHRNPWSSARNFYILAAS